MDFLYEPWPWYVAGPLIGLMVPLLLLVGNKKLGISSSLRQVCSLVIPSAITSGYDWKGNVWNFFFAGGVLIGGFLGGQVFTMHEPVAVSAETSAYFDSIGLADTSGILPAELFNWQALTTLKGFMLIVIGGFFVGFGTTWARGCTSGHGILGLSALQWPSLIATASFFIGGILFTHLILPYILAL